MKKSKSYYYEKYRLSTKIASFIYYPDVKVGMLYKQSYDIDKGIYWINEIREDGEILEIEIEYCVTI